MLFKKNVWAIASFGALLGFTSAASAAVIDFESYSHGDQVTVEGVATFSTTAGINEVWIYDSTVGSSADPDLNGLFDDISTPSTVETYSPGNMLIIQENHTRPDDEASGGAIDVVFSEALEVQSLNVFDSSGGSIELFAGADFTSSLGVIIMGDSDTSNSVTPNLFESILIGVSGVQSMRVILDDSGAIDDLAYTSPVPVPAAAWLFGSALMGLSLVKRRKA